MTRILSLSVAIAFLAGLPQLQADDRPSGPSPDAKKPRSTPETGPALKATAERFRSVRIVRDLAAFNILNLSSQKDGAWMVAGMYDGGSSGRLEGAAIVTQVWGKWKRIELLSGEAPPEGRYQWQEPDRIRFGWDRSKSIYDYSTVFEGPDVTVICRFFEKTGGAAQFSPVTAIPDDWKTFVKPAYEHHVRHWADFADSDLNGLRKIASSENPFIALTAIRHLLSRTTTAEEIDRLVDLASSLPKYRQAVLTFWLLKKNDDNARAIVLKAVSRSKSTAELTGMALGIESWTASQGRAPGLSEPFRNLRDKVMERWLSFDRSIAADEPWKSWEKILIAPGIPEGKSTQTNK